MSGTVVLLLNIRERVFVKNLSHDLVMLVNG